jgi:hypothetical protein
MKKRPFGIDFFVPVGYIFSIHNVKTKEKKMPDFNRITKMMLEHWPMPFVLRADAKKATGGVYSWQQVKNLDAQGKGPGGRFKIGKRVAYEKEPFFQWFLDRMT